VTENRLYVTVIFHRQSSLSLASSFRQPVTGAYNSAMKSPGATDAFMGHTPTMHGRKARASIGVPVASIGDPYCDLH